MREIDLLDEVREEMRIAPDRADRYEAIIARGEVLKDGSDAKDLLSNIKNNG